jgi:acyl carrier protein phosphodiesterase
MNFLAHFFLSGDDENLMVGNFLGDFVRNRDLPTLPPEIVAGVHLHRRIDSYSDHHPAIRVCTELLRTRHGKYAPVVIDVLNDYLLAVNWEKYHPLTLEQYADKVYQVLAKYIHIMPERLQGRVDRMVEARWLRSYTTRSGIEETFFRMEYRVSQPSLIREGHQSLEEHFNELDEQFQLFFPEAIDFAHAAVQELR